MKFIDYQLVEGRYIFRLCGIKLFTHKQAMKKKNNYVVLIKQNGKKVYNPNYNLKYTVYHYSENDIRLIDSDMLYDEISNLQEIYFIYKSPQNTINFYNGII